MRASLYRVMTTIAAGLIVVARVSAPGPSLITTPPRVGHGPEPASSSRSKTPSVR